MTDGQTIYALSSGGGKAGIAVIRVSGAETSGLLRSMCGRLPSPRRASLCAIRERSGGEVIDRGIVLWFPGPESFTGEDSAEFHVHGGRAVVAKMLDAVGLFPGMRLADPGEFTLRAFRGGRLDLVEAEGLGDLVNAETELQRRQALRGVSGQVSAELGRWRQEVLAIRARVEAAVDFVEEEGVADAARTDAVERTLQVVGQIKRALENSRKGTVIREGIRVVIVGPPNAGKSSLLNFLAGREAAIVSAVPGTTRDVIEVFLDIGGLPVVFKDTAGLRDGSQDEIEKVGMAKALQEAASAQIVIWLSENGDAPPPDVLLDSDPIWIQNKCDMPQSHSRLFRNDPHFLVSVQRGDGMAGFMEGLRRRITDAYATEEPAMIIRTRQKHCLDDALKHLEQAKQIGFSQLELQAEELRAAGDALGRLTGKINPEEVLGEIFSAFCIGK